MAPSIRGNTPSTTTTTTYPVSFSVKTTNYSSTPRAPACPTDKQVTLKEIKDAALVETE